MEQISALRALRAFVVSNFFVFTLLAAVALDKAVKFAELLGLRQRRVVIFPGDAEGLMGYTILVNGIAIERTRTGEQDYIVIAAAKTVELLRHAVHGKRIRIIRVAADPA